MWERSMSSLVRKMHAVGDKLKIISQSLSSEDHNFISSHAKTSDSPSSQGILRNNMPRTNLNQQSLNFPILKKASPTNPYNQQPATTPNCTSIQTRLHNPTTSDSEWFGTQFSRLKQNEVRLWMQNVNGIDISDNFNSFVEHIHHIKRFEISFLSITETKLNPYSPYVSENIEAAFQKVYEGSVTNISNQYLNNDDIYQYGGVLSASMHTMSQRVAGKGKDPLGRYNWIDFFGSANFLRIYTIYRINKGNDPTSGDDTCWIHQRSALLKKGITTDPRHQVVLDFEKQLKEDIRLNRSIIVCGDINEDVTKNSGFNKTLLNLGFINVIQKHVGTTYPFRTHNRGKHIIDGIWITPNLDNSIIRCGVAPFNQVFPADHRGIFLDINMKAYLDSTSPEVTQHAYRRLKYTIPKRVHAYAEKVLSLWKLQRMDLRLQQLETKLPSLSPVAKALLLNKIDVEINNIMVHGEKSCCKVSRHCDTLFSDALQKALRNKRQCKHQLSNALLKIGDGTTTSSTITKAAQELRQARKQVKHCKKNADSLRDNMYSELAKETLQMHPKRGKKKLSIIKQLKHCEKSRINSSKIRFATKGSRPTGISFILVPDPSAYTDDERNHPHFDYLNIEYIWKRTQVCNGKDIHKWKRIDDITIVTHLVTQVLVKHFGQSTGTPFANLYWKKKLSDPLFQQSLLDGTFTIDPTLPEEANELLLSFSKKPNVQEIPLLPTWKEFTHFIANSTEKTSSSPSGRHYGHYKSLLHSAPTILKGIYKLLCLSLQHGVVLERWKTTVTTLICKDDNIPYIHRLRPLHIIEAEMQFFSKCQWSHKLISQAERHKNITSSQYGGRKHKQAQSSVINTIVTFDIHRQLRKQFTFNDDDLRANYDRELSHYSVAETRCHGLSHEAGKMLIDITTHQKFYIKTKNGVSDSHYSFSAEKPVWGLGQGISWAGSCWQFTATSIEKCLNHHCSGAILTNPTNTLTIKPFLKFFIDDTTKICNYSTANRTLLEQTTFNMQKHSNYVSSTGGALALDKCRFYFIVFQFDEKHNPYILDMEENPGILQIRDPLTGQLSQIKRVEYNAARKSLGCFVSPSHNQIPQLEALKIIVLEWKQSMNHSSLTPQLIIQAYNTILKPQIVYRLSTTSLSFEQCDELMKLIRPILLNAHRTHKNFPKSILEAPSLYAGYNLTHFYDVQGHEKLKFFTYHMRLQDETGQTILLSLQYTQLMLGMQQTCFQLPYDTFHQLVDSTWLSNLWEYTSSNSLTVEVHRTILVPFQRSNDAFLIDILSDYYDIEDLIKLNKIRLSMKILFLSDVIDQRGRHLLPDIRKGITHRTTKLTFPVQTYSATWMKLWRGACSKLERYASANPLGSWSTQHFTWNALLSPCHMHISYLNDTFRRVNLTKTYYRLSENPTLLSCNIPVDIIHLSTKIQLISKCERELCQQPSESATITNPFFYFGTFERDNEDQIVNAIKTNRAKMSCDGSILNRYGSFAYGLAAPGSDSFLFSQHAPVHGDLDQLTSTRCELMGILACTEYLLYIAKKHVFDNKYFVLITADNQQAIRSPKKNVQAIKNTFSADMDLILQIQRNLKNFPFRVRFQHIKGHQDKHKPYESLSTLAKMNVKMDTHAKLFFTQPTLSSEYALRYDPSPASIVNISDPHSHIVKSFTYNLVRFSKGNAAEAQLAKALCIPQYRLNLLDWDTINKVYTCHLKNLQSFITKSIYRQLPTMHRQKKWNQSQSDKCPLCSQEKECADHLFQCTECKQQESRRKLLRNFRDELCQLGTDPFLQRHLMRILLQFTNKFPVSPISTCDDNPESVLAINEQIKLGPGNFCRGILVWRLSKAQSLYYRSQNNFSAKGETWARKVSVFLIQFSLSIWKQRCETLADSTDQTYEQSVRKQCKTFLIQLSKNPNQLPVTHRHLLKRKPEFTAVSTTRALTSWLNRIHYALEQATTGQKHSTSDIRNWFSQSVKKKQRHTEAEVEEIEFYTSQDLPYETESSSSTIICTVPYLPYVPYQQENFKQSSISDPTHSMNPVSTQPPQFYRDI